MESVRSLVFALVIILTGASLAYTADDVDLLARVVMAEAGGEDFDGQLAVAAVALNRVASPLFPNALIDVLKQPNQFASPSKQYTKSCHRAAFCVLSGYKALPEYVDMFQRKKQKTWYNRQWVCKVGNHNYYGWIGR